MKMLTEIEKKTKNQEELNKEELRFLFEMDDQIDGFGYQKDPRIKELRDTRNIQKDLPIIFSCQPEQIATTKEEVIEKKADFGRTVVIKTNDTKILTKPAHALDKNQELQPITLFLSLLNVSGVIPSIEARYCRGTWLNNSLFILNS